MDRFLRLQSDKHIINQYISDQINEAISDEQKSELTNTVILQPFFSILTYYMYQEMCHKHKKTDLISKKSLPHKSYCNRPFSLY